jgi:WD40 repeat protein
VNAAFCDDGNIVSGSLDKTFRRWSTEGNELNCYTMNSFGMWSLAFTKDGKKALTGSNDYTLRYWKLSD